MTIITGILIYLAIMSAFLMFFRHVHSCDDNMREAFEKSLVARQAASKGASFIQHVA